MVEGSRRLAALLLTLGIELYDIQKRDNNIYEAHQRKNENENMSSDDAEDENKLLENQMRARRLKMVGLFVASNVIELLSDTAAKFADRHNYHQAAQIIRKFSPYTIKSIDLFSKIDSNKRLSNLEKVLARDISEIKKLLSSHKVTTTAPPPQ
jgi:hypothetical protein